MKVYLASLVMVLFVVIQLLPVVPVQVLPSPPVPVQHVQAARMSVTALAVHGETLYSMVDEFVTTGLLQWDTRTGSYLRLPDSPATVAGLAVDPADTLWATSDDRLYAYNGITWTVYPAPDVLGVLAVDQGGAKWMGASNGLYQYSATGEWTYYTNTDGLLGHYVVDIAVDAQDRKWIATDQGVCVLDGAQWTAYPSVTIGMETIAALTTDAAGHTWVSDGEQTVRRFDGTTWGTISWPAGQVYPHIRDIVGDAAGNVWFATPPLESYNDWEEHFASIAVYHPDGTWATFDTLDSIPYLDPICAAADTLGNVYFGAIGVARLWPDEFAPAGIATFSPLEGWGRLTIPGDVSYSTGSTRLVMEYPASCAQSIDEYISATVSQQIISQTAEVVQVEVAAHLTFTSTTAFPLDPVLIPPGIANKYLGADGEWVPTDHPTIVALARDLTRDTTTEASAVEAIIGWVAENINYDWGWWQGGSPKISPDPYKGLIVFQWRYGVCTGFTNVAVALLRAAGIPARGATGHLIYTDGGGDQGGHAWVEAYYPDWGWVPMEPQGTANYVTHQVRMSGGGCSLGTLVSWSSDTSHVTTLTSLGGDPVSAPATADGEHISPLITPDDFVFVVQEGAGEPACGVLRVRRANRDVSGTGLEWTAAADQPWLTIAPDRGWAPAYPEICADGNGLPLGRHVGHVTLADQGNRMAVVEVVLAVVRWRVFLPLVVH